MFSFSFRPLQSSRANHRLWRTRKVTKYTRDLKSQNTLRLLGYEHVFGKRHAITKSHHACVRVRS